MPAISPSGWLNWREYWINAVASPSVSLPEATFTPPSTAMATYDRYEMNCMVGCIELAKNCAFCAAPASSLLRSSKVRRSSSVRPKMTATSWPEKDSSTCPFTSPVAFHWVVNCFWLRVPTRPMTRPVSGMASSATSASCQEIANIITRMPTTVRIALNSEDRDCCNACCTLSTSLVVRDITSPRWRVSK